MLERGLVEITSPIPGEYSFRVTAEGRAYKFADLKEHLECIFESGFLVAELDEAAVSRAIEHHGVFTFGKKA